MVETQRLAKQFIYALFYAAIFFGFFALVYLVFLKPAQSCFDGKQNQGETGVDCGGPCVSCELKTLKPIELTFYRLMFLNEPAAFFQLKNVNPTFGVRKLPYTLETRDSNGLTLQTFEEETFIYPGELEKNILKPIYDKRAVSISVKLKSYEWVSISAFSQPKMDFREIRKVTEENKFLIRGVIVNNDPILFPKVVVGALFYDKDNILVSASHTDVRDLKSAEARFFQIEHPAIPRIDPNKTKLFFEAERP